MIPYIATEIDNARNEYDEWQSTYAIEGASMMNDNKMCNGMSDSN